MVHSRSDHNAPPKESGIPSLWRSYPGSVIGYWLIKKWTQFGAFGAQTNRESKGVWIREEASTEREGGGKKTKSKRTRVGWSTPPLIASNQKDLLISHRKIFNPLRHIKPLDINRLHCISICIYSTKLHIRHLNGRIFAYWYNLYLGK